METILNILLRKRHGYSSHYFFFLLGMAYVYLETILCKVLIVRVRVYKVRPDRI